MEEAFELENYLPLSYKSEAERDYIAFLWDAFRTNYEHEKYQFAFLAYHMLTMSFVYFTIWQIRQARLSQFTVGLIGFGKDVEKNILEAQSPFMFSTVNERRAEDGLNDVVGIELGEESAIELAPGQANEPAMVAREDRGRGGIVAIPKLGQKVVE